MTSGSSIVVSASSAPSLLSHLNSPPLVASIGIVAAACLPTLQRITSSATTTTSTTILLTLPTIKLLNLFFYALNVYATQQPGRLDGTEIQEDYTKVVDELGVTLQGQSLFVPSGWAFAIWGPIFLGELIFTISSAILVKSDGILISPSSSSVTSVIRKASAGFMMSQLFQSLWSASFRSKYFVNNNPATVFISAAMLAGIAYSLSYAHAAYALSNTMYTARQYVLYFLPMSLHFGWTCAATLVNLNGSVAKLYSSNKYALAWTGHISAILATTLGVVITITRNAPVIGGVVAWALTAVSTWMDTRIQRMKDLDNIINKLPKKTNNLSKEPTIKDIQNQPGVYGLRTQKWLCRAGSIISGTTSLVIALNMMSTGGTSKR